MTKNLNLRGESDAVFFVKDSFVKIGDQEIGFLKQKVQHSHRKSIRLCMHRELTDPVHEMFILHSKEAYIRPHKHPGKHISYHVIEGAADLILFDEAGNIVDVIPLGEYGRGCHFYYRLNEVYYYTPLVRSDFFLFHETINGPFKPLEAVYASWAAEVDDDVAVDRFQRDLLSRVEEFILLRLDNRTPV